MCMQCVIFHLIFRAAMHLISTKASCRQQFMVIMIGKGHNRNKMFYFCNLFKPFISDNTVQLVLSNAHIKMIYIPHWCCLEKSKLVVF